MIVLCLLFCGGNLHVICLEIAVCLVVRNCDLLVFLLRDADSPCVRDCDLLAFPHAKEICLALVIVIGFLFCDCNLLVVCHAIVHALCFAMLNYLQFKQ